MKIFLSYASDDRSIADELNIALAGRGHDVFFDRDDLPAGETFENQIETAVKESDIVVFLISPNTFADGRYPHTELHFTREKWETPDKRVLPVMIAPTPIENLPPYLRAVTVLEPKGSVVSITAAEVDKMARALKPRWRIPVLLAGAAAGAAVLAFSGVVPGLGVGGVTPDFTPASAPPTDEALLQRIKERLANGELTSEEARELWASVQALKFDFEDDDAMAADAEEAFVEFATSPDAAVREAMGALVDDSTDTGDALAQLDRATGARKMIGGQDVRRSFAALAMPPNPAAAPGSPAGRLDALLTPADERLTIEIEDHPNAVVRDGDVIRFVIEPEVSGRLILIDRDAAGALTAVYPNSTSDIARSDEAAAGETLMFPSPALGDFVVLARPPFGKGTLYAIVLPQAAFEAVGIGARSDTFAATPVETLSGMVDAMAAHLEATGDIDQWGYAALTYEIAPRED